MNAAKGCSYCGEHQLNLLRCSRCKSEFYCSKVCQKQHWKDGHKERCTEVTCRESYEETRCSFCGQLSQDLQRCSRCKGAFYCSRDCQRQHWKAGHRQECKESDYKSDSQSPNSSCYFCNSTSNQLKQCTGCKEVSYCSKDCQTKDWTQRHRQECPGNRNKLGKESKHVLPTVERKTVTHETDNANGENEFAVSTEICPVCGMSGKLKLCQRCLKQKYCSTQCQKLDWKKHKENCLKGEKQREKGASENHIDEPMAICSYCKSKNTSLSCFGCKAIYYCSTSCQELDWVKHKFSCKSRRSRRRVQETLSMADCFTFGLVTPEENRGRNRNDGYCPITEEDKEIFNIYQCTYCEKNKVSVECPECKSSMYCSTSCRDQDKSKHQQLCFLTQGLSRMNPFTGMSNMIGCRNSRMNIANSPSHAKLPSDKSPLFVNDGADLNLIIERTVSARDKAVMKTLHKYPNHTLITRIREIPVEETSVFSTNICRQPLVFLSYIRRFHRYRGRHNVYLQDSDRREIYVSFYLPNDDPSPYFQWSDVVPGKFITILFPCIHFFADKTVGLRVDKASYVYCFDVKD